MTTEEQRDLLLARLKDARNILRDGGYVFVSALDRVIADVEAAKCNQAVDLGISSLL